jgi:hypothetical protein
MAVGQDKSKTLNLAATESRAAEARPSVKACIVHDSLSAAGAASPAGNPKPLELEKLPWIAIFSAIQKLVAAAMRTERLQVFGHTGGRAFHDACVAHSELRSLIAPHRETADPQGYLYSGDADLPEAWIDVCRVADGTAPSSSVKSPWPANIRPTLSFIIQTIRAAGVLPKTTIVIPIPDLAPAVIGASDPGPEAASGSVSASANSDDLLDAIIRMMVPGQKASSPSDDVLNAMAREILAPTPEEQECRQAHAELAALGDALATARYCLGLLSEHYHRLLSALPLLVRLVDEVGDDAAWEIMPWKKLDPEFEKGSEALCRIRKAKHRIQELAPLLESALVAPGKLPARAWLSHLNSLLEAVLSADMSAEPYMASVDKEHPDHAAPVELAHLLRDDVRRAYNEILRAERYVVELVMLKPSPARPTSAAKPPTPIPDPTPAVDATGATSATSPTHSMDFRSVYWFGRKYTFSENQAACVKVLWEHWEKGTPEFGGKTLLTVAESDGERIDLVFRGNPAWNTMIVKGETKGTRRLQEPARAKSDT